MIEGTTRKGIEASMSSLWTAERAEAVYGELPTWYLERLEDQPVYSEPWNAVKAVIGMIDEIERKAEMLSLGERLGYTVEFAHIDDRDIIDKRVFFMYSQARRLRELSDSEEHRKQSELIRDYVKRVVLHWDDFRHTCRKIVDSYEKGGKNGRDSNHSSGQFQR